MDTERNRPHFETYEKAKHFVTALPVGTPPPEISAEPDGEITFEWYAAPTRVFWISVRSNNELTYAGLFGESRAYGKEVFRYKVPEVILRHVKSVTS